MVVRPIWATGLRVPSLNDGVKLEEPTAEKKATKPLVEAPQWSQKDTIGAS